MRASLCCLLLSGVLLATTALAQPAPTTEDEVVDLVNQERWANGQLPPLKQNPLLAGAAGTHSRNMAERDFFAHCDLDTGDGPGDRISAAGYVFSAWGENIAAGFGSPAQVMNAWMNSSGHRASILSTSVREIGVGHYLQSGDAGNIRQDSNGDCVADGSKGGPYFHYWTQDFGRNNSVYPVVINREAFSTPSPDVNLYVYGTGWAEDMRFRNESGTWSSWVTYAENAVWTLSSGAGMKTVQMELRQGSTVRTAEDQILLEGPVPVVLLSYNARRSGADVIVNWSVADADDHAGFRIYRGPGIEDRTRLNDALLRGGPDYEFVDAVAPETELTYWLAEVSRTGEETELGSISVAAPGFTAVSLRATPNPFFSGTRIQYSLSAAGPVRIAVFDLQGSKVADLVNGSENPGVHSIAWNGRNSTGAEVPAGLYLVRLETDNRVQTRKVIRTR